MNRVLTALLFAAVLHAADCQPPPSMLALIRDPLVTEAVHRRIARQRDGMSPGGGDRIEAGVVLGDPNLIDSGLREFEWEYARQTKDGSFPETGHPFHSVSIFVLDSARALLVLREKRAEFAEFMPRLEKLIPHVGAAAG